ncbi:MAG TPA: hypothetical protein VGQ91_01410 [Ideonella sp.]|nr:hypothetical protein [Ideonella sp.]
MSHDFDDTAFDTVFGDTNFGDGGLPQDREARLAARRAFVDMKLLFLRATATLEDRKGEWLRNQVRLASEPIDLWLLRGPVLRVLSAPRKRHSTFPSPEGIEELGSGPSFLESQDERELRGLRAELYRSLDSIFPEAFGFDPGASLPPTMPAPWEAMAGGDSARGYIR